MTKEAINEYLEEVNTKLWVNDPRMQEYAKKECSDVYKTSTGHLIDFCKPSIKKDFCFGYGYDGLSSEGDYEVAAKSRDNAKSNVQYFINENMEQFEHLEEILNNEEKIYLIGKYWRCPEKIAELRTERYFDNYPCDRDKILVELPLEDIEGLKEVIKSEKQKFMKRLNTYLKRYGLSKLNVWTYLVD